MNSTPVFYYGSSPWLMIMSAMRSGSSSHLAFVFCFGLRVTSHAPSMHGFIQSSWGKDLVGLCGASRCISEESEEGYRWRNRNLKTMLLIISFLSWHHSIFHLSLFLLSVSLFQRYIDEDYYLCSFDWRHHESCRLEPCLTSDRELRLSVSLRVESTELRLLPSIIVISFWNCIESARYFNLSFF